ncbi:cytochrome [Leclercia sp. AS011]|uniref:cytochrome n=1 Tax=Leclercia sp. AS011 TaxID=3081257 RepID=UPI003019AA39
MKDIFKDLIAPRHALKISFPSGDVTVYARPMTVSEYSEHINNPDKQDRDELSILRCIVDENGVPVFDSVDEVKKIYTNVRKQMIGLISLTSFTLDPVEFEKK